MKKELILVFVIALVLGFAAFAQKVRADTPVVTIVQPSNDLYKFNTKLPGINYTAVNGTQHTLVNCIVMNATTFANFTLAGCTNISGKQWLEGSNTIVIYANDTNSDKGNATRTFWVDSIAPVVTITVPTVNGTNFSSKYAVINYTVNEANIDKCWMMNVTTGANFTLASCANITTNVEWREGKNNITIFANDTTGNKGAANLYFFVDTILPVVTATWPNQDGVIYDTKLAGINFTYSELYVDKCWVMNYTTGANFTLANCANMSSLEWLEGSNTIVFFANDTANNIGSATRTFVVDTLAPVVTIIAPANAKNFSSKYAVINYTVNEPNVSRCWVMNVSTGLNFTLAGCINITELMWLEGVNNITIFANDTFDRRHSASLYFFVDTVAPTINITDPAINNTWYNEFIGLDYVINEAHVNKCWWVNSTGHNISLYNATDGSCSNLTGQTWSQGLNSVTIYVNDSARNVASMTRTFRIDTVLPVVNITTPAVNGTEYTSYPDIVFNVTDTNLDKCWWTTDDSTNTTVVCGTPVTGVIWGVTSRIKIYANDSAGNIFSDSRVFSVTIPATASPRGSGGRGSSSSSWYWSNTYVVDTNAFTSDSGYTKPLSNHERMRVRLNAEDHYVGVVGITASTVTVNVSSEPQQAILTIGESAKFEVTKDDYYDLLVKLNSITNGKASLTTTSIHELVPSMAEQPPKPVVPKPVVTPPVEEKEAKVCTPDWQCSEWSECTAGKRARICTDSNNCGRTDVQPPSETEACKAEFKIPWVPIVIGVLIIAVLTFITLFYLQRWKEDDD